MTGRVADNRAALVGATIAGAAGAAWSGWAASGLSGPGRIVVRSRRDRIGCRHCRARYLAVGAGLVIAAVVGAVLAGSDEGAPTVTAVVALISAVTLLLAGAETLVAVSYSRSS